MRTKALFIALAIAGSCFGKDVKTVVLTTNPQMHCANCELKKNHNHYQLKIMYYHYCHSYSLTLNLHYIVQTPPHIHYCYGD